MTALLQTYAQLPLTPVRGKGCYLYDAEGTEYLDLYGGHAVAATGHAHPAIVKAIADQAATLTFYSNALPLTVREEAARAIAEIAPFDDGKVFFCNSGTEANEAALKIARQVTGRTGLVAMEGSFHGRTIASLSGSHSAKIRQTTAPLLGETRFAAFGEINSAMAALDDRTAALIIEPVQSIAGVRYAEAGYYAALRQLCSDRGALLIFDEVQTAPGRTGHWFAAQRFGVTPDIITTAKGIGSGFPAGVTIFDAPVAAKVRLGDLGSTFGGGPMAAAAIRATIELIGKEKMLENVRQIEDGVRAAASRLAAVGEVRCCGLLIGLDTKMPAIQLQAKLLEHHIIAGTCGRPETLRLLPPLNVTQDQLSHFFDVLQEII